MGARADASQRLASLERIARETRWVRRELAKMDAHPAWTDKERVHALKLMLDGVEDELRSLELLSVAPWGDA